MTSNTMTSDIQAGRALTLISIIAGILGFLIALLGGGVANCSGRLPDQLEPQRNYSSRKKVRFCFFFFKVIFVLFTHMLLKYVFMGVLPRT